MNSWTFDYNCLLFLYFLYSVSIYSQTTPQPTPPVGSNSIVREVENNITTYRFYFDQNLIYTYQIFPGSNADIGTFHSLKAYDENGNWFLPSNVGGVCAVLGGEEKYPWDPNVTFKNLDNTFLNGDAVYSKWKMMSNGDYCIYSYVMKIQGKTLIIDVEVDSSASGGTKATKLDLDRCENAISPRAIGVPYLSMFFILLCNNIYTSFFTDWEVTNCTHINLFNGEGYSSSSIRYAEIMEYERKTGNNGQRNNLFERLYLTTSPNINDVFPNIPNPISSYKRELANWIVWDYREPFARLIDKPWQRIQALKSYGINNIWIQIHDWQKYHGKLCYKNKIGYDDGLPCTFPANDNYVAGSEYGGSIKLNQVIESAISNNFRIGLHQNYRDYYQDADCDSFGWNNNDVALNSDGTWQKAFLNPCTEMQSYVLKPSQAPRYLDYWSGLIGSHYKVNGSYLDVHSCTLPPIDMDNSVPNSGLYRETVNIYRTLYDTLRNNCHGPVQGEGGLSMLYQGYVDDLEARISYPFRTDTLYNFPLFVDFDMQKLRSKTLVHGVGWYPLWIGLAVDEVRDPNEDEILSYVATEIAYGHGGYLPFLWRTDFNSAFRKYALVEYNHVFAIQQYLINATPLLIQYGVNYESASDYIRNNRGYAWYSNSSEYMGKIKITYDNGIVVYVNRSSTEWPNITVMESNGWFSYNAVVNGSKELYSGRSNNTKFTLPPNNGWLVFIPSN